VNKLVILMLFSALTISSIASAADAPRLIGEKEVMKLDDKDNAYGEKWGINAMRLSPDARRVLYLRKKMYVTKSGGTERGYKIILRDLKTGKDTAVPVPALFDDDFAEAWLSMAVFDPAGKTLIVPASQDANRNDLMEKTEKCRVGLYDIASGKLKTLDIESNITFPAFHPDGKTLVVMTMKGRMDPEEVKLHVTPTDKIKFRTLNNPGLPRGISPASGLMVLLLVTRGARPRPDRCVLYDMNTDTIKAELGDKDQGRSIRKNKPQWTSDGRYLYHTIIKNERRDGRNHRETLTRVWDVKTNKEASILSGVAPVGPGPGNGAMVLFRLPSRGGSKTEPRIVLHAQDDKTLGQKLHPLGDESMYPICTQGKWLLYRPDDVKGNRAVCLAEIVLP